MLPWAESTYRHCKRAVSATPRLPSPHPPPSRKISRARTLSAPPHSDTVSDHDREHPQIRGPHSLRHVALQAVAHSDPRRPEMTHTVSADAAERYESNATPETLPSHPIRLLRCAATALAAAAAERRAGLFSLSPGL